MKSLPIRCRPGDTRPIRAIAWPPTSSSPESTNENATKPRDVCPTHQFISTIKNELPTACFDILNVLDETAKNGPPANDTKFSFLKDGIFEFKAFKVRIACFFDGSDIVCTHGFIKKQQTTPKGEITKAIKMRDEYVAAKKAKKLIYV